MPSKSEKQAKMMAVACNNKEFANKVHIDQKVACDFHKADKKVGKYFKEQEMDKIDTITMDIPLFIRMLEFAREDAKTDMDLHTVTGKAIELSKDHSLSMDDYEALVSDIQLDKSEVYESIINLSKK